jgi:hypothetical protein
MDVCICLQALFHIICAACVIFLNSVNVSLAYYVDTYSCNRVWGRKVFLRKHISCIEFQ